jgi:NADH dehydrogenase [ubiquinone] 1 alpha subcomplex assembly factor 7
MFDATNSVLMESLRVFNNTERPKGPLQGDAAKSKSPVTPLIDELYKQITIRGPLTTAEYIRQCLYHPQYGYYMTRQPFGRQGDFVTSPEISQVFGELLCIWCVAQWQQMGKPSSFRLVELGPGRGTLMADFLRVHFLFSLFYLTSHSLIKF